jgi:hypothetical protein
MTGSIVLRTGAVRSCQASKLCCCAIDERGPKSIKQNNPTQCSKKPAGTHLNGDDLAGRDAVATCICCHPHALQLVAKRAGLLGALLGQQNGQ